MSKKRSKTLTERDLESLDAAHRRAATSAGIIAAASEDDKSDGAPSEELEDVNTGITKTIEASPELLSLFRKIEHVRTETVERSKEAKQFAADRVMESMPAPEMMSKLERTIRRLKWIITAIAVPTITGIMLAGHYIYSKAVSDTRTAVEQELVVKRIGDMERRIDDMTTKLDEALDLARRNKDRIDDEIDRGYRHDPSKHAPLDTP